MNDTDIQYESIELDSIYLDKENPRHVAFRTEDEVIEHLCNADQVAELADDIVKEGVNPLERWALIPDRKNPDGTLSTFIVVEGNRRLCALKLLADPDRAPSKLQRRFKHLASKWQPILAIDAAIFNNRNVARKWIERNHGGLQGGAGRKPWDAEQKARFTGDIKNKMAQDLLDYAEAEGLIASTDRHRKLTTVSRYLGNRAFRKMLGITQDQDKNLCRDRPVSDFNKLVERFMNDLIEGIANSRQNKADFERYAYRLNRLAGFEGSRLEKLEPVTSSGSKVKSPNTKPGPKKPRPIKNIAYYQEIADKLEQSGSQKLTNLYHSLCKVRLDDHAPLLAVGAWAFFECLAALDDCKTEFPGFFNGRLTSYGLVDKAAIRDIKTALDHISNHGNTTKHSQVSGHFDGQQLANDMQTLRPLIVACLDEIDNSSEIKK